MSEDKKEDRDMETPVVAQPRSFLEVLGVDDRRDNINQKENVMKTKYQVNSDYRSSHKTIAASNEVIELIEKVNSIQFERLGIKLKRTQTLVLVLKDYIAREEGLS